jgi:hypothetical protein
MSDNDKLNVRAALVHAADLAVRDKTDRRDFLRIAALYYDLISDSEDGAQALAVLARGRTVNVESK